MCHKSGLIYIPFELIMVYYYIQEVYQVNSIVLSSQVFFLFLFQREFKIESIVFADDRAVLQNCTLFSPKIEQKMNINKTKVLCHCTHHING